MSGFCAALVRCSYSAKSLPCYCDRLDLSFFSLRGLISLGLADATAFSRLPCFGGRHRLVRPPRSFLTRWLSSLAPLSSLVDHARLLGVSRRSWYNIVAYPGDLVFYNSGRHLFSPVEWNEGCWSMNSAGCCEIDKKNRPITSGDIIQGGRTCSDCHCCCKVWSLEAQ